MSPGTPIVLLHAYPLNGAMWRGVIDGLKSRTILTPDFPGFGGTPPGPDSLEGYAEEVLKRLDSEGVERAVFVGLSMGGYVAFRLHAHSPNRIAALVLADTRATPDDAAGKQKRTTQAERVRREGVGWIADAMLPDMIAPAAMGRVELVERIRSWMGQGSAEGVARALLAMRDRPDSSPDLSEIRVPVLAVVGEEDRVTPVAEARRIAESVPDGELRIIPGAAHLSAVEKPEEFAKIVTEFLAQRGL